MLNKIEFELACRRAMRHDLLFEKALAVMMEEYIMDPYGFAHRNKSVYDALAASAPKREEMSEDILITRAQKVLENERKTNAQG